MGSRERSGRERALVLVVGSAEMVEEWLTMLDCDGGSIGGYNKIVTTLVFW
jgi:hypothetical protein